jgi:hypothetical protein
MNSAIHVGSPSQLSAVADASLAAFAVPICSLAVVVVLVLRRSARRQLDAGNLNRFTCEVVEDHEPLAFPGAGRQQPALLCQESAFHLWCCCLPSPASCVVDGAQVDLASLGAPGCWMGDEALNAFLFAVQQRCLGRVLVWNTHFLRLLGGSTSDSFDYARVRRWTAPKILRARAGLERVADAEYVCVPVHAAGKHWWLAVCDLRVVGRPVLWCLDSARDERASWDASRGEKALRCLARWLREEHVDGSPVLVISPSCAPQRNPAIAGDCGVFTCAAADHIAACGLESGFPYTTADMAGLRRRIAARLVDVDRDSRK